MQAFIIFLLILSSGVVGGDVENLLRLRDFIIDIYNQFPHGCIFIIDPESQLGEDYFCIIYLSCVPLLN
jgi:hypothetical protein